MRMNQRFGRAPDAPCDGMSRAVSGHEEPPEKAQEPVLRILLVTFVVLTATIALLGASKGAWRQTAVSATGMVVYGALLALLPRWGARRSGIACMVWYLVMEAAGMAVGAGVRDVTMVLVPTGMFLAALLLPRRLLTLYLAASILVVALVGGAKALDIIPSFESRSSAVEVVVAVLLLAIAAVLTRLVVRSLQALLVERRKAEEALVESRNELAARNEALEVVNSLANRLHRKLDVSEIAREAVDVFAHVRFSLPPKAALYLLDEDGNQLRLAALHGFPEGSETVGSVLPVEGSLSGLAIRERRILTTGNLVSDARVHPSIRNAAGELGAASGLCIPVAFGDRALGTINLVFSEQSTFTPVELDTFRTIGQTIALAVSNARHLASVEHQAFHDGLTGLPNRAGLHREFRTRLARLAGQTGQVGLAILDLDRFREVNDALGHPMGDRLLVEIASRLGLAAREREMLVCRLGGDEFALLTSGIASLAGAEEDARRLLEVLREPYEVAGAALEIGATAGVALWPDHGSDSHEVLRRAEVALYRAKRAGLAVSGYAAEYDEHTPDRLQLAAELGGAIRDRQLVLYFQPVVSLSTGVTSGVEALVRWPHPRLGMLPPSRFLPVAEAGEMIQPLTYWVVEEALRQLALWHRSRPDLAMAVNLSVRNLLDRNCSVRLEEIIRRVGVGPDKVEFELTETAVMSDPQAAVTMLGRITATGARLAIDDFGTGYSSLTYLRRFPVHTVKIDRSFISEIAKEERSRAIVRSTISFARSLGLRTVAEGVEDGETARALREMGCELAQGFFFSPPAPAAEIGENLLGAGAWAYGGGPT